MIGTSEVIDGTRPLPVVGEAIVEAAKVAQPQRQPLARGDNIAAILDLIRTKGTEAKPLNSSKIEELLPIIDSKTISATLSSALLKEKHLHRRRIDTGEHDSRGHKISKYGYWFNDTYDNPFFGRKSLRKTEEPKKAKRKARAKVASPPPKVWVEEYKTAKTPFEPQVVQHKLAAASSLRITVGAYSFTPTEAREVYDGLKELFGN